mmetsp:Transcript_15188/g.21524  ORF Transcript_15188/g.21524 Transcript_15188/m.21524 type:complete len:119 (+) Transcript_15188:1-357(+)
MEKSMKKGRKVGSAQNSKKSYGKGLLNFYQSNQTVHNLHYSNSYYQIPHSNMYPQNQPTFEYNHIPSRAPYNNNSNQFFNSNLQLNSQPINEPNTSLGSTPYHHHGLVPPESRPDGNI